MKVILLTDVQRQDMPHDQQLRRHVDDAVLAEELGLDGYGLQERHDRPVVLSSPAVILSNIAARTSSIRLFTAVSTIGLHDPLRAVEDYSTLDNLSGGRLELVIGKGAYDRTFALFGVSRDEQWERLQENYALFRRLWDEDRVTWAGRYRPALDGAEVFPRPLRPGATVWHGSATSLTSADFAARFGEPIFSSNAAGPIERYATLIDHYREQLDHYGFPPEQARVAIGTGGYLGAETSQAALDLYRPAFAARRAISHEFDGGSVQPLTAEDWIAGGSALVGSPQQIIDKIHAQHARFGHELFHISVDSLVLTPAQRRATLELFAAEILPVIRRELPTRPLPSQSANVEAVA